MFIISIFDLLGFLLYLDTKKRTHHRNDEHHTVAPLL